ncbi:MAG: hypothetical protein Q7R35_07030 [Elusimicrobiota bacterium]|nr:hypothetical protein [Elusimicrobiota bacterium]
MNILMIAVLLFTAPAWSAGKKSLESLMEESKKAAETLAAESALKKEVRDQTREAYWDAQPEAEAVVPGQLLAALKKIPWPDPRPVPKEKYLERPEVKAKELNDGEADPLLAGLATKEKEVKSALEAAQQESDEARYDLWMENFGFYQRAINACEAGRLAGAERVKVLEAALVFVKEGEPRFHLRGTTDKAAGTLEGLEERVKLLIPDLYKKGQYIPDYRDMLWADHINGQLAGGLSGVGEKERQRYYKILERVRNFDPRAPQAEGEGGEVLAGAPAADAAKDAKWEQFLRGLVSRCKTTISVMNILSAPPAQYKEIGDKAELAIRKMLASFPAGWEKYPRAKWAHGWFSAGLEKAGKSAEPASRGLELFQTLNKYEAGLGPE